jgi:hypothetical protein
MEWILIAGALCLADHQDICIKMAGPDMPYRLFSPVSDGLPYWTLESAKMDGERQAREIDQFAPGKPAGGSL